MTKTKLLIFYLFLFSLLLVPSAFAINEVCGDGTNSCCSAGPNCPSGEYWNGLTCSNYKGCGVGESFFCGTGTCSADYCATGTANSGIENACCPDGQVLIADAASSTGWTCSAAGAGGSLWSENGSNIYYNTGNVSIGTNLNTNASLYSVMDTLGSSTSYGGRFYAGNSYNGSPATEMYGLYSSAYATGVGNVNTSYGIYTSAQNSSIAGCSGGDCALSYGVYALASGDDSRGIYAEGEYRGIEAEIPSTSTSSGALALLVDQNKSNETAARFECSGGSCTSIVALNGNDASASNSDSGYVIIGSPTSSHIAIDSNEIMAKSNGSNGSILYLNYQSGDTIIGDRSVYVNEASNRVGMMLGLIAPSYTLHVNGTVAGVGAYVNSSDERWKKDINPIESPLETILSLFGKTFEFRKDEFPEKGFEEGLQYGFIAQEVEKTLPEIVSTDDQGYKSIAYSKVIPILTEAIKEQQKEIDMLKALVCLDHPAADVCQSY